MNTLQERNKKLMDRLIAGNTENKNLRESLTRKFGQEKVDGFLKLVEDQNIDWKKFHAKLSEADVASSFPQFLRAGVSNIMVGAYQATPVTYTDWVHVVPSSKDEELYAPNHGVAFPSEIGDGVKYPEVGAAAMDIKLKNKKFGSMYSVSYQLDADDQTGTIAQQSSLMGQYIALLQEVLCYGKLASAANMSYAGYNIPVSETKPSYESAWPWSTALRGGGATRPSSFGALNQANIQNGLIGLMNQKNLQGIKMAVQPKRLILSAAKQFDASVLLNSAYYPSGAASAGNVGGAFAINPIKGIVDMTVSRFVFKNDGTVDGTSSAWYLVDDSKPWFVLQMRETPVVLQEAANTGANFELDLIRHKSRARFNADALDSRFAWQGSDGSV